MGGSFLATLSVLDLNTCDAATKHKLGVLWMDREKVLDNLKGIVHEKESIIKALEFKLNEISPTPKRNSRSR